MFVANRKQPKIYSKQQTASKFDVGCCRLAVGCLHFDVGCWLLAVYCMPFAIDS